MCDGRENKVDKDHAASWLSSCNLFPVDVSPVRKLSTWVFERLESMMVSAITHAIAGTLHQIHVHAKAGRLGSSGPRCSSLIGAA